MSANTNPIAGYETTIITKAEMSDEAFNALKEKINGVVAEYKGEVVLTEDWGKRKLAYPIQKEQRGQYTYIVYTGRGDIVTEMERNLRISDHVLRFLSVNLEKEFSPEAFKTARAAQLAAAKRREEEREARREERAAERRGYADRGDRGDRGGYSDRGDRGDRGDRDHGSVEASEE